MIRGTTRLLGLLGYPVSHSRSPAMHNAAIHALQLDYVYLPLPVHPDQLESAFYGLSALGFRGVNVTIPHKQAVMPLLNTIDPAAEALGAVNTIVFDEGKAHGLNTDWSGFSADLTTNNIPVAGRDCIVFGAGGSARAVVYALLQQQARIYLLARRREQAVQLASDLGDSAEITSAELNELPNLSTTAPLIINTTPLGMTPHINTSIWPDAVPFPPNATVYDLVYNPTTTKLMRQASAQGCRAYNGLGMLLWQGAQAFTHWTGEQPNIDIMKSALSGA